MTTKPYRPSNGTEGEIFRVYFCDKCQKDTNNDCGILAHTLGFNVGEEGYPKEWVVDADDNSPTAPPRTARCTAFEGVRKITENLHKQMEQQEREDLATVPNETMQRMARVIRHELSAETKEQMREAYHGDPKNWMAPYHHLFGMTIRNVLRRNGYDEQSLGIQNLDNVYVKVVELAIQ